MNIRPAEPGDSEAVWSVICPVIRAGETYALEPGMPKGECLAYWFDPGKETFVAEEDGVLVGTYYMRPNQAGGGRHICNCGYMVDGAASGRGVARAMCEHSLSQARERGYRGMQFNFVVSTNARAVRLWSDLGFDTLARLPLAFRHPSLGFVDALVMFQAL